MSELLVAKVAIKAVDGNIHVTTPYFPDYPAKARALGGVWKDPVWIFASQEVQLVRDLCQKMFGETGDGDEVERVNLVFSVMDEWRDSATAAGTPALYLAGRLIVKKKGEKVIFGDGVVLHEGNILVADGKFPVIRAPIGTRFVVRGLPVAVLKDFVRVLKRFKVEQEVVNDDAVLIRPVTAAGEILRLQASVEALQNQLAAARSICNRIRRKEKTRKLTEEVLADELSHLGAALRDHQRNPVKAEITGIE